MIPARVEYRYAGFHDPIQKITGDAYAFYAHTPALNQYGYELTEHTQEMLKIIVQVVKETPGLTRNEIAKRVGRSPKLIGYYLPLLNGMGYLVQSNQLYYEKYPYVDVQWLSRLPVSRTRRIRILNLLHERQPLDKEEIYRTLRQLYGTSPKQTQAYRNDVRALREHNNIYLTEEGYWLNYHEPIVKAAIVFDKYGKGLFWDKNDLTDLFKKCSQTSVKGS